MRAFIVIHIPTREFPANSDTSHNITSISSYPGKADLATGGMLRLRDVPCGGSKIVLPVTRVHMLGGREQILHLYFVFEMKL